MTRMRSKTSNSRLGQGRSASDAGRGRRGHGGLVSQRGSGGRRITVLKQRPKVWLHGNAYPEQRYRWPLFVLRKGCAAPLSSDCTQLQITPRWAIACFKPTYHQLRRQYGDDYQVIIDELLQVEAPQCDDAQQPTRGAEHELRRRIALAIAVLMNREGVPVRYPIAARFPRPANAEAISQPWLRALLTGWF